MTERPERPAAGTLAPSRLDLPTGDALVAEIFPPLATGVDWDLGRMHAFLEATGSPHRAYPVVHIAGTNGKGSVASTVASILEAAGHRTGLYTSPHLCHFRERFRVADRAVPDEELRTVAREITPAILEYGLTFFEAATALAFHAFRRAGVEVAVLEVGLGGRLDATNVVTPVVSAVTNVAMDHADYLGDTLQEIAREKAGIMKSGVPTLTAEENPEVLEVLRSEAVRHAAPLSVVGLIETDRVEIDDSHTEFGVATQRWGDLHLSTPLVGRHQAQNAALAVRIVEALPEVLRPERDEVERGVGGVRWSGRTQVERQDGRTWLFDVAHNPAGVMSLVAVLDRLELPGPVVLLLGVLGDKDWGAMLPPLFERADRAVLTQPTSAPAERRWNPEQAARAVGDTLLTPEIVEDFDAALGRATELAAGGTIVVTGSNHTVGDALARLGLDPSPGEADSAGVDPS